MRVHRGCPFVRSTRLFSPRINPKTHSETSILKQVFCIHSGMGLRNAVGNRGLRVRPAYLPQYSRYYQSGSDTEYKTVNPPRQRVVIAVFFVLNTRFFNLVIPVAFCIFFLHWSGRHNRRQGTRLQTRPFRLNNCRQGILSRQKI